MKILLEINEIERIIHCIEIQICTPTVEHDLQSCSLATLLDDTRCPLKLAHNSKHRFYKNWL